jgi:hypothetical protein
MPICRNLPRLGTSPEDSSVMHFEPRGEQPCRGAKARRVQVPRRIRNGRAGSREFRSSIDWRITAALAAAVLLFTVGGSQAGEWICSPAPPPNGLVVTASGSVPSCEGACGGKYVEPLSSYMVICAGQPIPEHYELIGTETSPACKCIARVENAFIIQLEKGYRLSTPVPPSVQGPATLQGPMTFQGQGPAQGPAASEAPPTPEAEPESSP